MNKLQLLRYVIDPTLSYIGTGGITANTLMLTTCVVESGANALHQYYGPAVSLYQIEPATHRDVWYNYLRYNNGISNRIKEYTKVDPKEATGTDLINNLAYSTAIARMCYYRHPFPLPYYKDVDLLWKYYKEYYNTKLGDTEKTRFDISVSNVLDIIDHYYNL